MLVKKSSAMKIMFRGIDPNKKNKSYIEKKLQKISRIVKNVLEFEVEVNTNKNGQYRVELMVKTPLDLYRAEEISESVECSMDIACEELMMQIVKSKSKIIDLKRRGARSIKKKIVIDKNARFKK